MIPPLVIEPWSSHEIGASDCMDTPLFSAAEMCAVKSRFMVNWYKADWAYAQPTAIAICGFIALFAAVQRIWKLYRTGRRAQLSSTTYRLLAFVRWMSIKQIRIKSLSTTASVAHILIVSLLGLFFFLMTFVPQPYYWPELTWAHSPPLATRTGWLALGLLPFLLVLSSKRNWIAYLTNTSHERLQFFHRWFAFFMLVLGLIHTFAFVKYNVQAGLSRMMWNGSAAYWTGVAMLVPQVWLTFASLAPFRNSAYEFFKISHRVVAIIFVVFFFLHCGAVLTSWDYFYALVAVYGSTILFRLTLMLRNRHKLRETHASLSLIGDDQLIVRIPNTGLSWTAGQHFFFRFLGLDVFDSWQAHPFTVATLPTPNSSDIVAVVKVNKGQTHHLAQLAAFQDGNLLTRIVLDGPYGVRLDGLDLFKNVLLLGGGSGLSFIVAVATQLANTHEARNVQLIASCKTRLQLQTFLDLLPSNATTSRESKTLDSFSTVQSHLTSDTTAPTKDSEIPASHRPDLPKIIREAATQTDDGRLAIVACGPASFMEDVSDEVAGLQMAILQGGSPLVEVYFHTENFSW